ncbi:MAG: ChaN family lipoprotein [Flavobacteriaceae bacterium]|nr:ChaN family lipoprotein [Flavobacteriaceae bacterium]
MKNIIVLFILFTFSLTAQKKSPYQIFNDKGKKVSYKKMLKTSSKTDIVLFGELHNNAIAHWLQIELTKDLSLKSELVLGFEMLEADNQNEVDMYGTDKIDQIGLDSLARLWNNYKTDYKPLVDFAKENNFKIVATNTPRRFASKVFRGGFESLDTLSNIQKSWIAPLPIAYDASLPGYVKMKAMMGGHGGDNLPKAQALKDATMAYFINENIKENTVFVHYNGAYHSDFYEGINWYLNILSPNKTRVTISLVEQKNIKKLEKEFLNKADFIIVVDEDMTKTY